MKLTLISIVSSIAISSLGFAKTKGGSPQDFYSLEATSIRGKAMPFNKFKDKAVLIVNTASKCGYTSQYEGLEKIHKTYQKKGLAVVAFPSNDFGGQEPGTEKEIAKFCKLNYGVTFALTQKIKTKGKGQSPVYKYLTANAPEKGPVSWNFEKFLVDRKGHIIGRFKSSVKPESNELKQAIEKALTKPGKS